jgi:peptidoglycan/xylan/chitin deacetylase (PgdA/CDA1 family)
MLRRLTARAHVIWAYTALVSALRARRPRVIVLRYHALGRPEDVASYASAGISLAPDRFDAQIAFLARRYDIIDLDAAWERVRNGVKSARPGVVITFDDGYRDNFDHALPILRKHGATGTFYVVAGSVWPAPPVWTARLRHVLAGAGAPEIGRACGLEIDGVGAVRLLTRRLRALPADERERQLATLADRLGRDQALPHRVMMDERELVAMADGGMTIGAHTLTHPLLPEVSEAEARHELVAGRSRLEKIVGRAVTHVSYPNPGAGPQHNAAVRAAARDAGYVTGTTSTGGILAPGCDPLALPRVGVTPGFQERLLFRLLGEG